MAQANRLHAGMGAVLTARTPILIGMLLLRAADLIRRVMRDGFGEYASLGSDDDLPRM